ncbi:MAG: hypothetical protein ACRBBZ_05830 [Nitrosopumilus sp.]
MDGNKDFWMAGTNPMGKAGCVKEYVIIELKKNDLILRIPDNI